MVICTCVHSYILSVLVFGSQCVYNMHLALYGKYINTGSIMVSTKTSMGVEMMHCNPETTCRYSTVYALQPVCIRHEYYYSHACLWDYYYFFLFTLLLLLYNCTL